MQNLFEITRENNNNNNNDDNTSPSPSIPSLTRISFDMIIRHIYNGIIDKDGEQYHVVEFKICSDVDKSKYVFSKSNFCCQWFHLDYHNERLTPLEFDTTTYLNQNKRRVKINNEFYKIKYLSNDADSLLRENHITKWMMRDLLSCIKNNCV